MGLRTRNLVRGTWGLRLTVGDPAGVAWAVENLDPAHISPGAGGMAVFHPDTRGL